MNRIAIKAEGISRHIIKPAFGQVEIEMPGFLFGAAFVQAGA